jgi:hypothetical protein
MIASRLGSQPVSRSLIQSIFTDYSKHVYGYRGLRNLRKSEVPACGTVRPPTGMAFSMEIKTEI